MFIVQGSMMADSDSDSDLEEESDASSFVESGEEDSDAEAADNVRVMVSAFFSTVMRRSV
jgi:hypothetical protein